MVITWIEPDKLAAGDLPESPSDLRELHAAGIRAIVTLLEKPLVARKSIDADLFVELDIEYLYIPVDENHAPTFEQADDILDFLDEMESLKRPVYIHSMNGVARTGTMLHVYYLNQSYSLDETITLIQKRKSTSRFSQLSPAQQLFVENFEDEDFF